MLADQEIVLQTREIALRMAKEFTQGTYDFGTPAPNAQDVVSNALVFEGFLLGGNLAKDS